MGNLATAQRELSRVAQISAQALGFFRSKGEPVWFSLAAILDDALALHQNRCRTLGVEVLRDYEPAPNIYSHPSELQQVMVNLIGNALNAMASGGKLRLGVRRTTDWVTHPQGLRITEADTGDGMIAETRSRLFEPFFARSELAAFARGSDYACGKWRRRNPLQGAGRRQGNETAEMGCGDCRCPAYRRLRVIMGYLASPGCFHGKASFR
jgi:light-regulated signal transduction histidine kinase (bacteriophytochrome)